MREELLQKAQYKNNEEREELKNYFTQPLFRDGESSRLTRAATHRWVGISGFGGSEEFSKEVKSFCGDIESSEEIQEFSDSER